MPENVTVRRRNHSTVEAALADGRRDSNPPLLALATAGASMVAIGMSFLFVMATDSCPADCDTSPVAQGMAVTWIGTAVVVAVVIAGIVLSRRNDQPAFFWPLLAAPAIRGLLLAAPAIRGLLLAGASIAETTIGQ